MNRGFQLIEVDIDLIRRLDKNGPRYTSYPTADRFGAFFDAPAYELELSRRAEQTEKQPMSLYFHLPFCNTVCYYCACNKVITKDRSRTAEYIRYLQKEMAIQARLLGEDRRVEQLHWGGGTPTFLSNEEMTALMGSIREHFDLMPEGEYSIEIDPRKVSAETVQLLAQLGFNRMSIGVQDFEPKVQEAVNRIQSEEETLAVLQAARNSGFQSISMDLIYGLPLQTLDSVERTLDKVIAASPDRLSLYSYAHLPHVFMPQRRIEENQLPSAPEKLAILQMAIQKLTTAGYVYIGMDHFARPDDELAVAQRLGRLHRNFQGYSTHSDCDMLAFGVSAIGKVGATYSQNARTVEEYYAALDEDRLPIFRGYQLSEDDILRREIIQALMCHFELRFSEIEKQFSLNFKDYFSFELDALKIYEQEGMLMLSEEAIEVTPKGRLLIRTISMIFDAYLQAQQHVETKRYSKVI